MTGNRKEGSGAGGRWPVCRSCPSPASRHPSAGFTLLELMIVISIIIILALIVMPQYNRMVQASKEAVLLEDLHQMRRMIDQYAADKGKLPTSPQDLVSANYLHAIPDDPMTENEGDDWNWVPGEDPNLGEGGRGLVNVCSSSPDISSRGTPYNNCDVW